MTEITYMVLFSVLAVATIGLFSMTTDEAHAVSILKYDMPRLHNFTDVDWDVKGNRSLVSQVSQVNENGKAKFFAKNTSSGTQNQVGVEWQKTITVQAGDTFVLTQTGTVDYVYFKNPSTGATASHFNLFPTIHTVGDDVGTTNAVWCDNPVQKKYTSNATSSTFEVTLNCNNVPAGDYSFNAYGHAFTTDDIASSSVSAKVINLELEVKRTRQ